jgi:23S rRNA (uracil1939-C5)-methyltransferase/tRNA (uracil-5-)-methyltransferase
VQELFERLGGLSPTEFPAVLDTIGTGEVYGYRSKITPHYDAPMQKKELRRARNDGDATTKTSIPCEIGPIGFKEKASHRLVDVPYCHIATPKINDALHRLREEKREEARRGVLKKPGKGATLLLRDSNGAVETNHTAYVNATVKGLVFRFQAGNFFQNNPYMLDLMVDLVVDAATAASPDGMAMTHLIDCYCGSGLFCIGSSSHFDVCVGIEVNEMAITEARDNALLNGIRNCDFVAASAEAIFSSDAPVGVGVSGENEGGLVVGDFPRDTTVVVLDPPRKGCSEEFLDQLNEYRPARVVYMSCDPATQARDAKSLLSFGYRIVSIQPFDLFPQTRHIECLAVFERMNR